MAGRRRTAIGTFGAVHYEKLPSGQIRARTRYRDDDGSLRRVSTVGATQRAAERNLKEALAARARGSLEFLGTVELRELQDLHALLGGDGRTGQSNGRTWRPRCAR